MDLSAALADMWRAIVLFVPKAVGFIAILLIGFLVAGLLRRIVRRLLDRFGFDRAVRRGGLARLLATSRHDASGIVALLAYYTVLLFTLQLAFGIWGPNPVSDLIAAVVSWLPRAIVAIIIVVVAAAIASAVKDVIENALSSLSYGRLLANLAAIFIVGLGVIAALNQIGVATTVTTPVLITVLATIGGILVVGVGGGMIRPMQERWERWLSKAEDESGAVRERIHAYAEARREAMEAEAAARREAANAPAVGSQPVETTYALGKASVHNSIAEPPTAPLAATRTDAPTVPVQVGAVPQAHGPAPAATPPQTQPQAEAHRSAQAQPLAQTQPQAQVPPSTQAQTQPLAQTQPQAQTQTEAQVQPSAQAQTQPLAQTQPQAQTQTEAQVQPSAQAQPQAQGPAQGDGKAEGARKGARKRQGAPASEGEGRGDRTAAREGDNDVTQILRPVNPDL